MRRAIFRLLIKMFFFCVTLFAACLLYLLQIKANPIKCIWGVKKWTCFPGDKNQWSGSVELTHFLRWTRQADAPENLPFFHWCCLQQNHLHNCFAPMDSPAHMLFPSNPPDTDIYHSRIYREQARRKSARLILGKLCLCIHIDRRRCIHKFLSKKMK